MVAEMELHDESNVIFLRRLLCRLHTSCGSAANLQSVAHLNLYVAFKNCLNNTCDWVISALHLFTSLDYFITCHIFWNVWYLQNMANLSIIWFLDIESIESAYGPSLLEKAARRWVP